MNTLKDRIMSKLTDLGMRRADLARATSLSRASISNILNGKTKKMSSETLFLIAGALSCNPGWLRDGQGPQDMKHMQASESRTIDKLRQLPPNQIAIIETLLDSMLEQEKNIK
jgi:transcriptional regulator with XRE-family HTH domain